MAEEKPWLEKVLSAAREEVEKLPKWMQQSPTAGNDSPKTQEPATETPATQDGSGKSSP
jgi:hypothetical protein